MCGGGTCVLSITLMGIVYLALVLLPFLSLQDKETALMKASKAGHMECVKVLLDKGAEVNMQNIVSDVMYPESPVVNDTGNLFSTYMPCYLSTERSTSLGSATCKESMFCVMLTSPTNDARKDKCKYPSPWLKYPILFIPFKWTNIPIVMPLYFNNL